MLPNVPIGLGARLDNARCPEVLIHSIGCLKPTFSSTQAFNLVKLYPCRQRDRAKPGWEAHSIVLLYNRFDSTTLHDHPIALFIDDPSHPNNENLSDLCDLEVAFTKLSKLRARPKEGLEKMVSDMTKM